jgi:ribokinase
MVVAGLGLCSLDYISTINKFPQEDSKLEVPCWELHGGGPVPTALVTLARFNVNTRFIGIVGPDEAGQIIQKGLQAERVDTQFMVKGQAGLSQIAVILANTANGTRTIFWAKSTAGEIQECDVVPSFFDHVSFIHLDGHMLSASIHAAAQARARGIQVMLDAGSMSHGLMELIELCDYVVASQRFSEVFGKGSHEHTLRQLLKKGIKAATVTLGQKGSITATDDGLLFQPAFPVKAVDSTGAGDVFHGAYIYGLINHWPVAKTIRFASWAAAMKCRKPGGRAGIPTIEEAAAFLKNQQ